MAEEPEKNPGKRKAEDRLSIEDATSTAEVKRREIVPHVPKEGLPLELQMAIWVPVTREMNVLDLLDLAWVPSWGMEGVRKILANDDMWTFFWVRDFRNTGYCKDIPLRIPEFLTAGDDARNRDFLYEGDEIFLKMPWRRYYLWTHYALRTLSKIVVHKVNESVLEWKLKRDRKVVEERLPMGVSLKYSELQVMSRSPAELQVREIGPPDRPAEPYGFTINQVIDQYVEDVLDRGIPRGGIWVASQMFWDPPDEWSIPVYVARYLIVMGLPVETAVGPRRHTAGFFLHWLIWCLTESNNANYDQVGPLGPEDQGGTRRDVLIWMALRLRGERARFPMPEDIPIVPRKIFPPQTPEDVWRNKLFLGDKVCANCEQEQPTKRCARCKDTLYCSKDCQVAHWHTGHKNECQ